MKIPSRLIRPALALLLVLLAALSLLGLRGMAAGNASLQTVYEDRTVTLAQLGEIQARILGNANLVAVTALDGTPEVAARNSLQVRANLSEISRQWLDYTATLLTPEEKRIAERWTERRGDYLAKGMRPALALMEARDFTRLKQFGTEILPTLAAPARAEMDALIALQQRVARQELDAAEQRYRRYRLATLTLIAAALAAGFVLLCQPAEVAS